MNYCDRNETSGRASVVYVRSIVAWLAFVVEASHKDTMCAQIQTFSIKLVRHLDDKALALHLRSGKRRHTRRNVDRYKFVLKRVQELNAI